jgi:hypothetical protein
LPLRLVRAIGDLLPVDGVGLSVVSDDFRVPLAATSEPADRAERLQFTLGDGPCLSAARQRRILATDDQEMRRRWPMYAEALSEQTPYRAVVTIPVGLDSVTAAIDLYFSDAKRLRDLPLVTAAIVVEQTALALGGRADGSADRHGTEQDDSLDGSSQDWLKTATGGRRAQVWVATGIVMVAVDCGGDDALALMRSAAYAAGVSLDEVAAELVAGTRDPSTLQ